MKDPARVPGWGGGVIQECATWLKSKVAESPFCVPQVGVRESLALATIEMICAQIFPPPIFSCTHPPLALKPVFGLGPCSLLCFFLWFPTGVSAFLFSGPEVETPGAIQLFFFAFVVSVFVGLVPVS